MFSHSGASSVIYNKSISCATCSIRHVTRSISVHINLGRNTKRQPQTILLPTHTHILRGWETHQIRENRDPKWLWSPKFIGGNDASECVCLCQAVFPTLCREFNTIYCYHIVERVSLTHRSQSNKHHPKNSLEDLAPICSGLIAACFFLYVFVTTHLSCQIFIPKVLLCLLMMMTHIYTISFE